MSTKNDAKFHNIQESIHNGRVIDVLCEMIDQRPQAIAIGCGPQLLERQGKIDAIGNVSEKVVRASVQFLTMDMKQRRSSTWI